MEPASAYDALKEIGMDFTNRPVGPQVKVG